MAKKQEKTTPKQVLERTYNIPLRRDFLKAPRYKRAKKAVGAVRGFLERHMKGSPVRLGSHLNRKIWEKGAKNPPHHVKVTAVKYEDESVKAELIGFPLEEKKEEPKKRKAKKEEKPSEAKVKSEEKPKTKEKASEKTKVEQPKKEVTQQTASAKQTAEKGSAKESEKKLPNTSK